MPYMIWLCLCLIACVNPLLGVALMVGFWLVMVAFDIKG